MTKINYKMNGKWITIEVEDEFAEQYKEIVRKENCFRMSAVRHESIFTLDFMIEQGNQFAANDVDPLEQQIIREETAERRAKLKAGLATLTDNQRKLVNLIYVQKRSLIEIAEEDGVTYQAVQNRLEKILKKLKKLFI